MLYLCSELCKQFGAEPLNIDMLIGQSAVLTAQGATMCTPELLSAEGGVGLGPCLEQLGLFGYEVAGGQLYESKDVIL